MQQISSDSNDIRKGSLKEFFRNSINGDGIIYLIYSYSFFGSLALKVQCVFENEYDKLYRKLRSEFISLWVYDYRFQLVDENPLPIEKLSLPNIDEGVKSYVQDTDYVLSIWNKFKQYNPEELKEVNSKVRENILDRVSGHAIKFDETVLPLFNSFKGNAQHLLNSETRKLEHIYRKEFERTKYLNWGGHFLRKIVFKIIKIKASLVGKTPRELLIERIFTSTEIDKKISKLVYQSFGLFQIFKTGEIDQSFIEYIDSEIGIRNSSLFTEYFEERKKFEDSCAKLQVQYIIAQVIRFYQKADLDIPRLDEVRSQLFFDVNISESDAAQILFNPTQKMYKEQYSEIDVLSKWQKEILNAKHDRNSEIKESTLLIFLLDWFDENDFYPGMEKSLYHDLSKEFVSNNIVEGHPSQKTITNKLKFIFEVQSVPEVGTCLLKLYRSYKEKGSEKLRK